jgi:hypothetical protein
LGTQSWTGGRRLAISTKARSHRPLLPQQGRRERAFLLIRASLARIAVRHVHRVSPTAARSDDRQRRRPPVGRARRCARPGGAVGVHRLRVNAWARCPATFDGAHAAHALKVKPSLSGGSAVPPAGV